MNVTRNCRNGAFFMDARARRRAARVRRRSAEVALVSARLRGGWGGGVSPPDLPLSGSSGFGADRRLGMHARFRRAAALAPLS